jgi:chemotaxis protein histidine kinase CheA/ActR/RegA family two-component response regulator
MTTSQPTAEQQELIGLLLSELSDLASYDLSPLHSGDDEAKNALLDELFSHLDNLGHAARLVGLEGMERVCEHLKNNFILWQSLSWSDENSILMAGWCPLLTYYLNAFGSENEAAAVSQMLEYVFDSRWPHPLLEADRELLRQAFSSSEILADDASAVSQLPAFVDDDMVSLAVDTDVNRDLLNGLLQELPEHSASFSRAVARLVQEQDTAALAIALRAAHTIKGAANLVGIRGLANLMHYTEDLLEQVLKIAGPLAQSVLDLLEDTADALASISEYLIGLGPKPAHLVDLLNRVLTQLRAAYAGQWEYATGTAVLAPIGIKEPSPVPVAENSEDDHKHHLTVTETMAHELLRIAGENQIGTNQVLTRISQLVAGVKSAESYHQKIRQLAASFDHLVQLHGIKNTAKLDRAGDFDPLEMERFSELHSFTSQLQEVTTDSQEAIYHIEAQLKELTNLVIEQRHRSSDAQNLLLHIRMLPVSLIAPRLARCVRQAARLTQKHVRFELHGEDVLVDSRVLNTVVDPLMHLLRNAVDHGIEPAERRLELAKDAEGVISVSFERSGENLHILVRDDGGGLDYARIEGLARERGILELYENPTRAELHKILLTPGFSTRVQVSQTSGRGIGLDVVATQLRALKGSMSIHSELGRGCAFALEMPMSILSAHTLVVKMGAHKCSIVSRGVEQLVYILPTDIDWAAEKPKYIYNSVELDVLRIDDLAMMPGQAQVSRYSALLIAKRGEHGRVAIAVESILASEDHIIKPLNKYSCKPAGVVGAAILGDGSVSPVLDLQDFPTLQMNDQEYQRWLRVKDEYQARVVPTAPKLVALVVDDSLSARRALAQFMTDLGLDVQTAKDGFEAIAVMEKIKPDILLVDLEMPRMNGLELTNHIRAGEIGEHMPIVMVTSRVTDKHRQMAAQVGVDAYLNKPWTEEDLMKLVQEQLPEMA